MKRWHAMKVKRLAGDEMSLIKLQGFGHGEDQCFYAQDGLQSVSRLYCVI